MEHSGAGIETIKAQMAYCRGLPITPIVRVPSSDYHFIARVLDAGARGIMVPMVESRSQAETIVAAAKYPPQGRRGAAFGVAHDDYRSGPVGGKMRDANDGTLLIALVETKTGAENLEEIAATPGIDVVWLGHFDLTNSLGIPEGFDDPRYLAVVDAMVSVARRYGKTAGFMASDEMWARDYAERGFRMLAYGLDLALYQRALAAGITLLQSTRAPS
jgi:2-keto-3-deoxy-L-rhamnonate aldolase RhmA